VFFVRKYIKIIFFIYFFKIIFYINTSKQSKNIKKNSINKKFNFFGKRGFNFVLKRSLIVWINCLRIDCTFIESLSGSVSYHHHYTNENTDRIFLSVNCNEIYKQNIISLYPPVNTDKNISSVYTERITVEKEEIKKLKNTMTCHLYRQHYRRY
jgi:hypothetical protein